MKNEVVVNPIEFGLEEEKANELTVGLKTILLERVALVENYEDVINLEITEENLKTFKELRLRIRDNRTKGIEKWHKTNKAFFLTGGRFVDAIKNKEVAENERMEEALLKAEKHFENLEKERLEKLQNERVGLITTYVEDADLIDLSSMDEDFFNDYLQLKKTKFEEAEKERLTEEKRVEDERLKEEARLKAIEVENAKLKKEAEEKEVLHTKRNKELQPYIVFIRNYNDLINKSESEYQKEFKDIKIGAEQHWEHQKQKEIEAERLEDEKQKAIEVEQKKQDAILQKERQAKAKLEAELKAKKDAEILEEKKRQEVISVQKAEAEAKAKAPIKDKLNDWISKLEIDTPPIDNEVTKEIIEKFNSFKKWASKQVKDL